MIEMMEKCSGEVKQHLNKKPTNDDDHDDDNDDDDDDDVKLSGDEVSINNVHRSSSSKQMNFTDRRTALVMLRLDSATAESGDNYGLAEVVREVAMSVTGEVVVVEEEAVNSVVVVFRPYILPPTGSHVLQLVTLARKVISTVRCIIQYRCHFELGSGIVIILLFVLVFDQQQKAHFWLLFSVRRGWVS